MSKDTIKLNSDIIDFKTEFYKIAVEDFLKCLIDAMKHQKYDTIHIDQLIELRHKIQKGLL